MVKMIVPEFRKFHEEGAIIGRLLAGYGSLENALASCVAMAKNGDLDTVIKVMFRTRGETQRIDVADAVGRPLFQGTGLEDIFSEAVADMHFCRKIRNQYAHCHWHDDNTNRLVFIDLEEIARPSTPIKDLTSLTFSYLDVSLLKQQEAYFVYVADCLIYLNYEFRARAGKLASSLVPKPKKEQRPPLCLP